MMRGHKRRPVPIIDAHVHLYPNEVNVDPAGWAAAHGETHWATLCTRRRRDGSPVQLFPSVDTLLREMDEAGIARSVLLGWYWERPETCVAQNLFLIDCARAHPDRLSGFAAIHAGAGADALDAVRRAQGEGLIGLGELSPHAQRTSLADPTWREIMALAGELKLPVNLHVTDPRSKPFPGRIETPEEDFVGLAREFPATTFILAHWGGGLAFDAEHLALRNLYYDTAASPLLYGSDVWQRAVQAVGSRRILFGSDNPLRLYPKTEAGTGVAALVNEATAQLSSVERDHVLGGNAARLLKLV